uniref:Uncharacterized protein n=1 Tax=Plectus sambesii TaxID=2011161 RepID=A0A914WQ95_9BILA
MAEGGKGSRSGSDSDDQSAVETNLTATVNKVDGLEVQLVLQVRGLKPKGGLRSFLSKFSNHDNPTDLCANAEFTKWDVTSSSLSIEICVHTEKERKKKKGKHDVNTVNTETFTYKISNFPSEIRPEKTTLEIKQPPGETSYSFIVLTLQRVDKSVSWENFRTPRNS